MKIAVAYLFAMILLAHSAYSDDLVLKTSAKKPSVDFFKEEITLSVNDSDVTVNGVYYFRNNTDKIGKFPVLFPFHVDSLSLFPNLIKAYIIDSATVNDLNYQKIRKANSISIAIPIKSQAVTIWHLDYSQKIKAPKARYIITTTNAWDKPLEEVTYKFIVPSDFDSLTAWPTPDTAFIDESNMILICHKTDFLPQQDMEISWRRK